MRVLVNIDVDDLERAIRFYTSAFGMQCNRRLFHGSVAELVGSSAKVYLLLKPAGTTASSSAHEVRHYARHWTPVHLDFEVMDIAAAVSSAVVAGATVEGDIQCFAWGRHAQLSDPFGNGFCIVQFSPEGYSAAE